MSFYDFYRRCFFECPLKGEIQCNRGEMYSNLCLMLEQHSKVIHKAHRQSGKTSMVMSWAVYNALIWNKHTITIYTTRKNELMIRLSKFLNINDVPFSKHSVYYTFNNGSTICVSDDYRETLNQYTPSFCDLYIIDDRDYKIMPPYSFGYTKFNRLSIFYTSYNKYNRLNDILYGVNDFYKSRINYLDDGYFTDELIEKLKNSYGENEFEAEFG